MAKFARCSFAKTTANCFNSFCHIHLISSVSPPQRPLIYDCIYFSFPTPVANISGKTDFLGALFNPKVPLETVPPPPPPQLFDASYAPDYRATAASKLVREILISCKFLLIFLHKAWFSHWQFCRRFCVSDGWKFCMSFIRLHLPGGENRRQNRPYA